MHFHTLIQIIDDTIQSTGTPYRNLPPREKHIRDAMFLITVLAPIAGAFLAAKFAPRGFARSPHLCPDAAKEIQARHTLSEDDRRKELDRFDLHCSRSFRYNKLVALWFLSIGVFGALVYFQSGRTTRGTFVLAVAHNQIEVLLNCLLLNLSYSSSVSAAIIYGFVMYPVVLFAPSMALVFIGAAVVGGANDFLIVCLLSYAKQWVLAVGAMAHVFSAVSVFTCTIDNFGVIPYNLCIFLGIWTHISLTVSGILYARDLHRRNETHGDDPHLLSTHARGEPRRLSPQPRHVAHTAENGHGGSEARYRGNGHAVSKPNGTHSPSPDRKYLEREHRRAECYARNPMRHTYVPRSVLVAMIVLSLVGATLITVALAYWVPLWGAKLASRSTKSWIWDMLGDSISPGHY